MHIDLKNNISILGDNLSVMKSIPDSSIQLIYVDPPFNTGIVQKRAKYESTSNNDGLAKIGKKSYLVKKLAEIGYSDIFNGREEYLDFLLPRLQEAHRILKPNGSIYVHLDYREIHYVRFLMDAVFGEPNFLNEIIWAFDYGAKAKNRWPVKHQNILYYAKNKENYIFNVNDIDRIPYMAPGMVSREKADIGKLPTSCWWITIVSPMSKEKTGYPNQKPMKLLERVIRASSNEGDTVLDFFSGSGTTGDAAMMLNRKCILIDKNPEAIETQKVRFAGQNILFEAE